MSTEKTVPKAACDNCIMFSVCQLRLNLDENILKTTSFLDWDKPGGAQWLTRWWQMIAERCRYYEQKIKIKS